MDGIRQHGRLRENKQSHSILLDEQEDVPKRWPAMDSYMVSDTTTSNKHGAAMV